MIDWSPTRVAQAAGAQLLRAGPRSPGPNGASIDSRDCAGMLFVGLPGERVHGGAFGAAALEGGAWGVLTDEAHAAALIAGTTAGRAGGETADAVAAAGDPPVLAAADPLRALQDLARAWRRALGAADGLQVIGVTGSTGKTSTKDLLRAVLAPHRTALASRANFNTEIGLPLELLRTPAGTDVLVLEMGMRGPGQIAELAAIAEPDVGVIVSLGPVHLELLGSLQAIAAAKAELIAALPPGATAVVPAGEPLLAPHLRPDLRTVTCGPGGDVRLQSETDESVTVDTPAGELTLGVSFRAAHLRRNLLAAVAAAQAVGVTPAGTVALELTPGRGQAVPVDGDVVLLDGAYNANPMSMRAALDELDEVRRRAGGGRAVAVLGDMLELGPEAPRFHREVGVHAGSRVDVLVTVGPLAREIAAGFGGVHHHVSDADAAATLVPSLLAPGDVVLVKGSLGVGLRAVSQRLTRGQPAAGCLA